MPNDEDWYHPDPQPWEHPAAEGKIRPFNPRINFRSSNPQRMGIFGVGLSYEQEKTVDSIGLSLGTICDIVWMEWIQREYGLLYHSAHREQRTVARKRWMKKRQARVRTKKKDYEGVKLRGILLTQEQQATIAKVIDQWGNPHGAFASLFELSMRDDFEKHFGVPWPHHKRMYLDVTLPRIMQEQERKKK